MRKATFILFLAASQLLISAHSQDWETCNPPKEDGHVACGRLFSAQPDAVGTCIACYTAAYNACMEPTGTAQQFVQCDPTPSTSGRNNQQYPVWNCSILQDACKTECSELSGNESFKTACVTGCSSSMVVQQCLENQLYYPADSLAACRSAASQVKSVVMATCNASQSKNVFPSEGLSASGLETCKKDAETKFERRELHCYWSFKPLKKPQRR